MPRRRGGLKALLAKKEKEKKAREEGRKLQAEKIEHVQETVNSFKKNLEEFASKHRDDINRDPEFRRDFQVMCQNIGVDPLSSSKGFWADLLGLNDFYYELGVQIIDVCLVTRSRNGGLLAMSELLKRLHEMRGRKAQKIGRHDIKTAVLKLKRLGSGFKIVNVGENEFVMSVPVELSREQGRLLDLGQSSGGFITIRNIIKELKWTKEFSHNSIDSLLREGMVWLDSQSDEDSYWFPSQFFQSSRSGDGD